jgi:hypothetical protein
MMWLFCEEPEASSQKPEDGGEWPRMDADVG